MQRVLRQELQFALILKRVSLLLRAYKNYSIPALQTKLNIWKFTQSRVVLAPCCNRSFKVYARTSNTDECISQCNECNANISLAKLKYKMGNVARSGIDNAQPLHFLCRSICLMCGMWRCGVRCTVHCG